MKQSSLDKYASILNAPYTKSRSHPWMKPEMRAAQFAPFSALTGHEAAVKKVCQYLEEQKKPAEYELDTIKRQLDLLQKLIEQKPLITISFTDKDNPATIIQLTARVKGLDEYTRTITMDNGRKIPFGCILEINLK